MTYICVVLQCSEQLWSQVVDRNIPKCYICLFYYNVIWFIKEHEKLDSKDTYFMSLIRYISGSISCFGRCMRLEKSVSLLMNAVYIITMLLPIVPDGMVKHFDEMFGGLIRLISFAFHNKGKQSVSY